MTHEPILVSMAEGAAMLGLCRRTMERQVKAGRIGAVKDGRRTLLPVQELRNYAAALPRVQPTPAS